MRRLPPNVTLLLINEPGTPRGRLGPLFQSLLSQHSVLGVYLSKTTFSFITAGWFLRDPEQLKA